MTSRTQVYASHARLSRGVIIIAAAVLALLALLMGLASREESAEDRVFMLGGTNLPLNVGPRVFAELAMTAPKLGPDFTPVTVLVYASPECSECGEFWEAVKYVRSKYPQFVSVAWKAIWSEDPNISAHATVSTACGISAPKGPSRGVAEQFMIPRISRSVAIPSVARCLRRDSVARLLDANASEAAGIAPDAGPIVIVNGELLSQLPNLAELDSIVASRLPKRRGAGALYLPAQMEKGR